MAETATYEVDARELEATFGGELIHPHDPSYDSARRVWNGMIDRRPALIARCTGAADVIAAVGFARENDFPLAVRGGGHNIAGNAVCDDGVMVDLSPMRGVHVDPRARIARAQGGVTLGLLDRETQVFGLATPAGIVSSTGIGGLTLGGGLGYLSRMHGTACDNLRAAQVVTASGELVSASEGENPDLFWGLRGGGGNFGVVTAFEYELHPVGPMIYGGAVFHPGEDAAEVVRFFRDFAAEAPDELSLVMGAMTAPPAPFLPAEAHGKLVLGIAAGYFGGLAEGERFLAPLRSFGRPLADLIGPMPYTALQALFDESLPAGLHGYWKSNYINELGDGAVDVICEHAERMPPPFSQIFFQQLGGAIARADEDATAFGHRDGQFDFVIVAMGEDQAEVEPAIAWAREFWTAMQPFASEAVYVNDLGVEGEDRVRAAYTPEKYERLVALKDKYDPGNLFRLNQNIKPSGPSIS
jgi:FAD/FMN-containing dehydrogenase